MLLGSIGVKEWSVGITSQITDMTGSVTRMAVTSTIGEWETQLTMDLVAASKLTQPSP